MLNISMSKKMMKTLLWLFIIASTTYSNDNDKYIGYWLLPNKKVIIEIKKDNNQYAGYVRWLKEKVYPKGDKMEGLEQIDRNNPSDALKNRKVMNLQVVGDMIKNADNNLVNGWVYDSWNGKKYYGSAKIIDDNHIKLKGSLDKWNILGYSMIIERVDLKEFDNN